MTGENTYTLNCAKEPNQSILSVVGETLEKQEEHKTVRAKGRI